MNFNYGEMMSILKKIKLALLASAVMLSPQGAYALGSDPEDAKERGCIPQTSPRVTPFEGEETRGLASSSQGVAPEIQKTTFISRIPKKELYEISSNACTNAGVVKILEAQKNLGKPSTSPQSSRKEERPSGTRESLKLSRPSSVKPTGTQEDLEKTLPVLFLELSKRYITLRQEMTQGELRYFNDLYRTFIDVLKLYQVFYPDFDSYSGIIPDREKDLKGYQAYQALTKIHKRHDRNFVYPFEANGRKYLKGAVAMGGINSTNIEEDSSSTDRRISLVPSIEESKLFKKMNASSEGGPSFSSSPAPQSPPLSPSPQRPSQSSEQKISPAPLSPETPRSSGGSVIPSALPVSPPPQRPSRPLQKISSPPLSPRPLQRVSPHQSSPALWLPSGFSGESVIPSSPPAPRLKSDLSSLPPRPRNATSSSSQALWLPPRFSGESDLPPPTPPRTARHSQKISPPQSPPLSPPPQRPSRPLPFSGESVPTPPQTPQKISPPQSPPVPLRLRSDLRPLPSLPRNVVSSSSRLLPQPPQSSGESVPPPPVAPRHRSLSLSPKATFSGLSPAGLSSVSKK